MNQAWIDDKRTRTDCIIEDWQKKSRNRSRLGNFEKEHIKELGEGVGVRLMDGGVCG